MSKNWYDSDNPTTVVRGFSWRAGVWIALVVIFFAALGGLIWVLNVATSPVKGQGDAYQQKNSAVNRIASQATFEDLYADYQDTLVKIEVASDAYDKNPKSQIAQTNLAGLINYCVDVVGDYNAESRKYLAADFKAVDLPYELDRSACNLVNE